MIILNTSTIPRYAKKKVESFYSELLDIYNYNVHSVYVIGEGLSNDAFGPQIKYRIDGIIVLKKQDRLFNEVAAPVASKYLKKPLAVPLVMSIDEFESYIEIFPLRFLNHCIVHQAIYGEDLLENLSICHQTLMTECRHDVRGILNRLLNDFISCGGDKIKTANKIKDSFRGDIPLFRGLIKLTGVIPPINHKEVIIALPDAAKIKAGIFKTIYELNTKYGKISKDVVEGIFDEYYSVINELDKKLQHSV